MNSNVVGHRKRFVLVAALGAVVVAGCTNSIQGVPAPEISNVDLGTLQFGAFPHERADYVPKVVGTGRGVLIPAEARRLQNFLITPSDVDSAISRYPVLKMLTIPEDVAAQFSPEAAAIIQRNRLVLGVYGGRTNGDARNPKRSASSLLQFETPDAAQRAAEELKSSYATLNPALQPASVSRVSRAITLVTDSEVYAFLARGVYLALFRITLPKPDRGGIERMTTAALDLQAAKLESLKPTPWDEMADIPSDRDAIMRRALPATEDFDDLNLISRRDFGWYEPSGALHFERDSAHSKAAFEEAGVDVVGRQSGVVYRAKDAASAVRLQAQLAKPVHKDDEAVDPPTGLPDAKCVKPGDSTDNPRQYRLYCVVSRGRFVAVVGSFKDQALYEKTAAQYSILAKGE